MSDQEKESVYLEARRHIASLLDGSNDGIAAMASTVAVLFDQLSVVSWAGFYRVVEPRLLRVGPYQGPIGCLEISFEKGVCGAAARERQTQVVADVHAFPGHIACDSAARSEIVVPIFDRQEEVAAVLDLDSHQPAAFDGTDRKHLETIARMLQPYMDVSDPG